MIIKINGKAETVDKKKDLAGLITGMGLSPDRIVVEHNFTIVPKESWHKTLLNENDNVEIVSFVGGG